MAEDSIMQAWIAREMRVRCHPTRLWVPCDNIRGYDAFIPCPQELMDKLAEDYSISKGWCDFKKESASITPLVRVDAGATRAFQKPQLEQGKAVRLAFLLTVYADAPFVERLFSRIYGSEHYYLLHVDPSGASADFERSMRELAARHSNVFLSKDIPIVYGASTATILLTRAMAWFLNYASGWDYFLAVTGSDYPLMPLPRLEKILVTQQVCDDICLHICLSLCQLVCLSVCLSVYQCVCMSVYLTGCMSVYLSIYPYVCLSVRHGAVCSISAYMSSMSCITLVALSMHADSYPS
jgi:Core-2/I-Branching enzyme